MARILIIDDDPDVRDTLAGMLKSGKHTVTLGSVGSSLLNDLQTIDYDVVITDLNMPVLDGWDVAAWLRERRPGVAIIAIGGDVRGGHNAPMDIFDGVLAKPFGRKDLLALVGRIVAGRKT